MNLNKISLFLLTFSMFSYGQETKPGRLSQTDYLRDQLPAGIASLPSEGIYRIERSLKLDTWSELRKDKDVKEMLSVNQEIRRPTMENSFPFENYDADFKDIIEREFGVCSGFSTLQRNFSLLMHFDLHNKHNLKLPKTKFSNEWYNYYFKLIDSAALSNPVIIPGYDNLGEFFSESKFQQHVKKSIIKMWAQNNASIQGIEQLLHYKKKLPKKSWAQLHQDLSERLKVGYNPIIFTSFASTPTIKKNIHVLQVIGISGLKSDSTFDLTVWDDGVMKDFFGPFTPEKLVKTISFRKTGEILWLESPLYLGLPLDNKNHPEVKRIDKDELIDETFWVSLLPNDDKVMSILVQRKLAWCKSNPKLRPYCFDKK